MSLPHMAKLHAEKTKKTSDIVQIISDVEKIISDIILPSFNPLHYRHISLLHTLRAIV